MRIRPKIQIAFLAVGLLPLLLFGWFSLNRTSSVLSSRFIDQLDAFATVQETRIEMLINHKLDLLKLVSSRTQLRINLKNFQLDPQERFQVGMERILQDAQDSIGAFHKLSVVGLDGRILASTESLLAGRDISQEPYFRYGLTHNLADTFALDEAGSLIIILSGPLVWENETIGVIVAESSAAGFLAVTGSYQGLGKTGETILVKQSVDGRIVYLTPLRFDPKSSLRPVAPTAPDMPLLKAALDQDEKVLRQSTDYRGFPILAVTRKIHNGVWKAPPAAAPGSPQPPPPSSQLGLIVKIDRAEVFGLVQELQRLSWMILGGTFLTVLLVSVLLSNSITRPIRRLAHTAMRIGEGDLSKRAQAKGNDEIARLAQDFNRMAQSLTEATRTLENKVVERTQQLAASQERFTLAVRGSNDGIWDWNVLSNEVFYSDRFKELLGYPPDGFENVFASFENRLHPADREPTLAAVRAHLERREPYDVEYRLQCRDGLYRWFRARGVAVWDDSGRATRMAGSISDVTDRKLAEEELVRSNQELDQFASVASHDLKEPLRMVVSYLQLLRQHHGAQLTADAGEFIRFAIEGALRMQQLIEGLLLYSRIGTRGEEFSRTDIQSVLDIALANLKPLMEERGAQLVQGAMPEVLGDETQLVQLFQNLIGNAIKFCPKERTPEIHLLVEPKDDAWLFQLTDNGIGIEPNNQQRIFQIFQRAVSRNDFEGTGIGLAICQKIVERHNGRIWVESEPGQGSTFFFSLPVLSPSPSPDADPRPSPTDHSP